MKQLCAFALCLVASAAAAQAWPVKPIRIIVPHQVGGQADPAARMVNQYLTPVLGQTFIVDNRPGAAGMIGAEACAKAAPDGYTFCVTNTNVIIVNPLVYPKLPYDPPRDYAPVIQFGYLDSAVVVNAALPVNSMQELIALAKAKPESVNWASFGEGSPGHLYAAWYRSNGVPFFYVPYKTGGQTLAAVVSGEAHVMNYSTGSSAAQYKAGKVKLLAAGGERRSPFMPDVPSYREAGIDTVIRTWVGMFAPAATPKDIVLRFNAEIARLLNDPKIKAQYLTPQTIEPAGGPPEAFAAVLREDREKYARLVKIAGVKPE